jgi:tetratricopeptide (TPR) repeat protein
MDNKFESGGGEQNVGIGKGSIGKQENNFFYRLLGRILTVGNQSPAIGAGRDVAVNYGIPPAVFAEYAGKLAVTDSALASFFKIMEQQQVPHSDLDSKLREIAGHYKLLQLMAQLNNVQSSSDPQMRALKEQARQAIEAGDFAKAEYLLEDVASHYSISAAETYAELASLQRVQLRYAKAAAYWQKAAALLPEDKKNERALYLNEAGVDLYRIAKYKEALPLYEQSLAIFREIGDKAGEGVTLNNIGQIYDARGDYPAALKYLKQSLAIYREIGDKEGEGTTLNNISQIYDARGDSATALTYLEQSLGISREIGDKQGEGITLSNIGLIYHAKGDSATALTYLEQSLIIRREIGDKEGEGTTLNNISQIYDARSDYPTALKYLEQSLAITQEIGDRRGEAETSWNIGMLYKKQGDLAKAEQYISHAVQLAEEIGHPKLEEYRPALAELRTKLRGK